MRCEEARERLLEAAPGELRAGASGPLARHLARCTSCRAAADRVLRGTRALQRRLERAPTLDVESILAQAAEGREEAAGGPRSAWPGNRLRRRLPVAATLAAAAGLAALLFVGREEPGAPPPPASLPTVTRDAAAPAADLTPPPDRNAMVLETRDPDITVIWLYGEAP